MNCTIEYYSPKVEKTVLSLPEGIVARYLRLSDLMLEFGPNLGCHIPAPWIKAYSSCV